MAIYKNLVKVPDNVSIKKSGNFRYVYHICENYRTKNGTWTHRDKAIGRLNENDITTMFPNGNYFEIFKLPHPEKDRVEYILNTGHTYLLSYRAKELKLTQILKEIFPDCYEEFLKVAIYMVCEGNVMMYMDDFYEFSDSTCHVNVSEKHLTHLYSNITKERIWAFFKLWIDKNTKENDVVAYDVTSISTYSENLEFAEMGYNRDKENLAQINVGLMYSQSLNMPLCYELYDGSIPDKIHFETMFDLALEFSLNSVIFVMDRGFLTRKNLSYLKERENIFFILAFPSRQKTYENILLSESDTIRHPNNYSIGLKCYDHKKEVEIDNYKLYACSYFNTNKAHDEEILFGEKLKREEENLKESVGKKKRKKTFSYFETSVENEVLKSYDKNEKAIADTWKTLGMFGLLTNVKDLSWEDVLKLYRQRDRIEKNYDNMKNNLDFSRLRTHNDENTQGKFFMGFLAQILQGDLANHLGDMDKKPVSSIKKLLNEMKKIRKLTYSKGDTKLMAPLSKKQKDILKLFGINEDNFVEYLFSD